MKNPLLFVAFIGTLIFGATQWLTPGVDDAPAAAPPPPVVTVGNGRALTLRADGYGQFWTPGRANGAGFEFLVDTGAGNIIFSRADASKLGLSPARLVFDGIMWTANGRVRTASARVAWLQVGPFLLRDVPVSINDGELDSPLLGMAFLRRFKLTVRDGALTIEE